MIIWSKRVGRGCWQGVQGKVQCGGQDGKQASDPDWKPQRLRSTSRRTRLTTNTNLRARRAQLPLVSGAEPWHPTTEAVLRGFPPTTRDITALRPINAAFLQTPKRNVNSDRVRVSLRRHKLPTPHLALWATEVHVVMRGKVCEKGCYFLGTQTPLVATCKNKVCISNICHYLHFWKHTFSK